MTTENCKACNHVERGLLDKALQSGTPLSVCAARFGLTEDALSRHRQNHVEGVRFSKGIDPAELIATLQNNLEAAQLALMGAEGKERIEAMREVRMNTEALAKLVGAYRAIDPRQLLPFWNRLKSALLEALRPHPEAREAVLVAVERLMAESGE